MQPDALLDALEVITAVDLGDFEMFQRRKRVVSAIALDEETIVAKVRTLQVMRLAFHGRFFDLEMKGIEPVPAVVIFALDAFEVPLDLVAWPIDKPAQMTTLGGHVALLGEGSLHSATPFDPPVRVFRSAMRWLRAGCAGVVPIDARRAARAFLDFDGQLVAEDDAHGRELTAARANLVDRTPAILVAERCDAPRGQAA